MEIRRLGRGDEDVVCALATRPLPPELTLLEDERTIFLAAFDEAEPVGFVLGYVLPRRHGDPSILFVYEVEVDESYRRRGIATALMRRLGEVAGAREGFVLTEHDNEAANSLYRSVGGQSVDVVQWDFEYADA